MNCPTCGAPVAEGMSFCTQCGAQFNMQYQQPGMQYQQQPQQPQYQQPQYQQPGMQQQPQYQQPQYQQPGMQPQQPQYDPNAQYQQPNQGAFGQQTYGTAPARGSFIEMIKSDPIKITTYVGFFFLFLASWFPRWVQAGGSGAGLFAADGGILKLWGILLLLFSVWGMLVEFGSYIPALNSIADKYKKLPFSQFYLPCACLIIFLLATFNGTFRSIVSWGKLIGGAGYGFAMWICLLGVILITIRPVMALVKKQDYWNS